MLWFAVYLLVAVAAGAFATKKWGRQFYHRWGRWTYLRRIVGKSRPPTPPLVEEESNISYHRIYDVFDDGSIIEKVAVKRDVNSVIYCYSLLSFMNVNKINYIYNEGLKAFIV